MKGPFQRFIPFFWASARERYLFLNRPAKALCAALPKSSSFYCGVSPRFGKHVIFQLQHSDKAWQVGEFVINVHISKELTPTNNWCAPSVGFKIFEDGCYRLSHAVESKEHWWCLKRRATGFTDRSESRFRTWWEPSSYDDESVVFSEATRALEDYLEANLFDFAGFTPQPNSRTSSSEA